jgi:hypothetical protein
MHSSTKDSLKHFGTTPYNNKNPPPNNKGQKFELLKAFWNPYIDKKKKSPPKHQRPKI